MRNPEEILEPFLFDWYKVRAVTRTNAIICAKEYAKQVSRDRDDLLERLRLDFEQLHACYMQARRENMDYENIIANLKLLQRRRVYLDSEGEIRIEANDYGDWILYEDMMYFINGQTGCNAGSGQ